MSEIVHGTEGRGEGEVGVYGSGEQTVKDEGSAPDIVTEEADYKVSD